MTYSAGEALALTQVQATTAYSTTNSGRGTWYLLNSGNSATYAILRPGAFERIFHAMTQVITTWETVIEVWQLYRDDGTTMTDLESNMQQIINRFDQYRLMGDTTGAVVDAKIQRASEPIRMSERGSDAPLWYRWDLVLVWKEETSISYGE